ncbi:MAG TPA: hypothetical protein VKG90_07335 [Marmoricola sp.]|nr:hypothetical protein [Marmoricola sp.]
MSHPTPTTLYRIGAGSGVGSALILLVNAAKRASLDQHGDRAHLLAEDEVAFPMTGHRAVLDFSGAFADVHDPGPTATTVRKPDPVDASDHPTGAQVCGQLLAQCTARLHEQCAVDALVRHLHLRVVGIGELEPAGDLLGRPSSLKLLGHDASQHRVDGQLACLRSGRPCPRLLVSGRGPVALAAAVAGDLTADRRR